MADFIVVQEGSAGPTVIVDPASYTAGNIQAPATGTLAAGTVAGQLAALEANKLAKASVVGNVRLYRDLGSFVNSSQVLTGTLKITLPVSWSNTAIKIIVSGFDYKSNSPWHVEISGQNKSSGWTVTGAILSPNCPFSNVRFAHDGVKCCILLGTTSTVWTYPSILIKEVSGSYVNAGDLSGTWDISFITNETGITVSSTPTPKILIDSTRTDVFVPLANPMSSGNVYHYRDIASIYSGSVVTGTLKITLPVSWTDTLLRISIKGKSHLLDAASWFVELHGYNKSSTSSWSTPGALLSPNCPFNSVRFAHDGTKCCILLGTTTTVWTLPLVTVDEVFALGGSNSALSTGWALSFITDETGITVSQTAIPKTLSSMVGQATAVPTAGTYALGDMVKNSAPTPGGYYGWVCTTAGTPGTWKGFGLIQS